MNGKVVIITGAGSGFGAATSVEFASKGCLLALVDKNSMEDTQQKCIEAGLKKEEVLLIQADLTVMEQLKEVPLKAVEYFGKLDVLINNAGIAGNGSLIDTEPDEYDKVLNINCKSVFFLSQATLPYLTKTKGNIVNVSSIYALRPSDGCISYCVSKSGVNQITQCAALELGREGIRVNAVNPGHAFTSIMRTLGVTADQCRSYLEGHAARYPLGRIAKPEDIAKAIAFLADDSQASFITGVCLPVDGGFILGTPRS